MQDDYTRRLAAALAELEGSGIKRANYAPPLFRVARAIGLRPRPPHYMGFLRAALLSGPAFGLIWGLLMWVVAWQGSGMPMGFAVLASLLAGVLFGLAMAGYYRWAASEAGLSRWHDL
ncbi:DUF6404 family protein [Gymnodinialimonas ulvae]|uniref:DUF6404 family protein n=1 Tax=Gymnodinialimonas ulvae TaxID=3126504 RepID=UPI0030A97C58